MTQNTCLNYINYSKGIKISGANPEDRSGSSLDGIGDFNGDGFKDFIIGAPEASPNSRSNAGIAYVIFGKQSLHNIDLSSLDVTSGFSIFGSYPSGNLGFSVSGIGDINKDGYDDITIGAPNANTASGIYSGIVYIIFGSNVTADLDLFLQNDNVVSITGGSRYDRFGYSVSNAGDVNNDGFKDIVIGAPWAQATPSSFFSSGTSYIIFGSNSLESFIISSLDNSKGIKIVGELTSQSGASVSFAGDMNKDGYDDVIIGAPDFSTSSDDQYTGRTYIIFGGEVLHDIDLISLNEAQGISMSFSFSNFNLGSSVSYAGDMNGDNYDDVIVGAPYRKGSGFYCVIFGNKTLSNIRSGSGGDKYDCITGERAAQTGGSVSGVGDFNGDGYDDVVVGAQFDNGCVTDSGKSFVIYGSASKKLPEFHGLKSSSGFYIGGEYLYDSSGASVSKVGDINGDGYDDVLIGSPYADPESKISAGNTYLFFGGPSPTHNPTVFPTSMLTKTTTLKPTPMENPFSLFEDIFLEGGNNLLVQKLTSTTAIVTYTKGYYSFPYGQVFDSNFFKIGEDITLSSGFSARTYSYGWKVKAASISPLSNGGFVFTWQNVGSSSSGSSYILYKVFDQAQNPTTSDSVANYGKSNLDSFNPSVVPSNNGGFIITWQSYGLFYSTSTFDITSKSFNQDGFSISSGSVFGTNAISMIQSNPSTEKLSNDNYVLTWYDQSSFGIYAKVYNSNFNVIKSDFKVNTDASSTELTYPLALALNNQFVITWESKEQDGSDFGVFGQLYSNSGSKIGTEFQVNTETSGFQGNHNSAPLNQDTFCVVWESKVSQPTYHVELNGQLFSNNANKIGPEFRINSYNSNSRGYPSVAALGDKSFIVSWSGEGLDEDITVNGVFIKFFDINTVKSGNYNHDSSVSTVQPTIVPTFTPTYIPTVAPTNAITITSGSSYNGSSASEKFIIDVTANILIYGGEGNDTFTINPNPGVNITIGDFDKDNEKIDLSFFENIQKMDDFTITAGSAIINLEDNQKVRLLNLEPSDMTADNFIFSSASDDGDNGTGSDYGNLIEYGIIAAVGLVGLSVMGCLGFAAYRYCGYKGAVLPTDSDE